MYFLNFATGPEKKLEKKTTNYKFSHFHAASDLSKHFINK